MRDVTLVFDLDGTLVDTAPDLIAATNHALDDLGLAPVPAAVLRPTIGFGARRMIVEGLAHTGIVLGDGEVDRLLARFLAYYEANIAEASRPFPGALDALQKLRGAGARLAVCTNKREGLSRTLLDALTMSALFDGLAGKDTFPVSKPDPGHLLGTIARAGGLRNRALMIGDTNVDVATAKAAHVPVIACAFGYSDVAVENLGADRVIAHFDELADAATDLVRKLSPEHRP